MDDQKGLPRYVAPSIQTVHARITICKGVVPLEPSHDEYWRDGNQILMVHSKTASISDLLSVSVVIRVQPEEWDTYYQRMSYWYFTPDDLGQPPTTNDLLRTALLVGTGEFSLTAAAVRDPAFAD